MKRNKVIVHNRLDLKSLRRAMCNHNHQKSDTLETEAARAFSMFVFSASVLTHTSAVVYFLWGFPVSVCLSVCLLLSCSFFSFQNIHNCIIAIMSLYMYFFWQSKHQALNLKSQIFFSICRFNRPSQCLRLGQCPDCPLANLASWTVHADILIYWKQTKVNIKKGSN